LVQAWGTRDRKDVHPVTVSAGPHADKGFEC